ncbi:MAG: hypothetical protein V7638_672 [Acidobacteriota bacterium]|jgi:hypothetical protein
MDSREAKTLISAMERVDLLLATDIFSRANQNHPLLQSAFIDLLICLRHLTWKSDREGFRVSFTDDLVLTAMVKDVTDAIKVVRDALCHPDSDHSHVIKGRAKRRGERSTEFGQGEVRFVVVYGKIPAAIRLPGELTIGSEYDDDVCFWFGTNKLYLKRHILRAFEEAKRNLIPLFPAEFRRTP